METLTPGHLDAEIVKKKIDSGIIDVKEIPFFDYLFVKKWGEIGENFQEFLSVNLLSSHLWIVAQKVDKI